MLTRRCLASLRCSVRAFASQTSLHRPPRLLRPYNLALQLKQLSADGNVTAAVQRLRSVPKDAQNVPAWNTMLSICMHHKKFQLAYTLFTDMKRRGFSPNITTFVTMFKGLSQVSDWSNHPKQLANAHALYRYYLDYTESIRRHDPDNIEQLSLSPLVIYIRILGAAGDIQKIFDVYFAMDQDGPHAPDRFVFTAMLRAIPILQDRQQHADVMSDHDTATSNAKYIWLQVEKAIQRRPNFELDSRLIAAAIQALARGRPADQNLALDIIIQHLGLTRPDHPDAFRLSPHLNYWTLDVALQVCLAMQKFRLCVHFMRLVMDNCCFDRPDMDLRVANCHIQKLLRAYASLAMFASPSESSQAVNVLEWCLQNDAIYDIPDLRPDMRTYHLVLMVCLRTTDWEGALKAFQLMTGIQIYSFHESEGKAPPMVQKRPKGRNLTPNVETMSFIMRTAFLTNDNTKSLQAIWLAEYVGIDNLLQDEASELYYRASFARALASVINQLWNDPRTKDRRKWFVLLKARAQDVAGTFGYTLKHTRSALSNQSTRMREDGTAPFDLAASSKPRGI